MKQRMMNQRYFTLLFGILAFIALLVAKQGFISDTEKLSGAELLAKAFREQQSDLQIEGEGTVTRILPDDLNGSKHQRFILQISPHQQVLVAHNIDLAPKIKDIKEGDRIVFFGEYEWNARGGVIHWTHHDPDNRHIDGWLKHQGHTYQ